MDYWKQRRAYRSLKLIKLNVSAGQNNLYRELLDYANDENLLDDWFEIKNEALVSLTGLSDRGMKEARNVLVQSGLVEYKPGKKSAANPQYRIICLYHTTSALSSAPKSAPRSTEVVPHGVPQVLPHEVPPSTYTKTDKDKTIKTSRAKPDKRVFAPADDELVIATDLWDRIKTRNPEAKVPNLQHWADDIRKMHELDKRPFEKIRRMVAWCQQDEFWCANILSAAKLRKHYDQMAAKANSAARPRYGKQPIKESEPEWRRPDHKVAGRVLTAEERAELDAKLASLQQNKGDAQ